MGRKRIKRALNKLLNSKISLTIIAAVFFSFLFFASSHKLLSFLFSIIFLYLFYRLGTYFSGGLKKYKELYESISLTDEITQNIISATNLEEVINMGLMGVSELIPESKRVILFWIEEREGRRLIIGRAGLGIKDEIVSSLSFSLDKSAGVIPRVIEEKRPYQTINAVEDYYCNQEFITRLNLKAFIVLPISLHQKILGVLLVEFNRRSKLLASETKSLSSYAGQLGIALENARLYRVVETLSITDALTQIYNRGYFDRTFERELNRSARYKHPISLIMGDIDHFKIYNDNNGHQAGDKALYKIGQILKKNVRETDFACRYGGEEFVIILTETGKEDVLSKAEELRRRVEEYHFPDEEKQPEGKLTISFGAASFPEDAITEENLLRKADKALYRSKEKGRNRVSAAV